MKNPNQWFCGVEGQQFGPFTWEQMRGMAAEGRIVSESFVRRDVDQQWFQASQIPGLLPKAHHSGNSSTIGKAVAGVTEEGKAKTASKAQVAAGSTRAKASDSATIAAGTVEDTVRSAKVKPTAAVAPKAIPRGVPVGRAVPTPPAVMPASVPPHAVQQTVPTHLAPPTPSQSAGPPEPARKSSNAVILVAALGGVAAVVGVVGVGFIVWNSMRPAASPTEQLAASLENELKNSLEQVAAELEGNPLAPEVDPQSATELQSLAGEVSSKLSKAVSEGKAALPDAAARSAPAAAPAAAKLVASIPNWTSVVNLRGIALNNLRLQVTSAWLAADDKGARVEPSADGQSHAAAKFVFVEVRLTNMAPVARKYKSWNTSMGTSAVLADQANQILAIVPPVSTPGANRLTEVNIAPGESVTDQLVFAAPAGAVERLRLALAKSALAEGAKFKSGSHFALEIPLEVLLTKASAGRPTPAIEASALANQAPASSAATTPTIIAAPVDPVAASAKPMEVVASGKPEMKAGAKPPSVEELNRQFEEMSTDKGKDKEMEKKSEAQK